LFACEKADKKYIVLSSRDGGMFSIFMDVLSLVCYYEKGFYNGIEVDFGTKGFYYSENHGTNWWGYYCEPIQYGKKINIHRIIGNPPGSPGLIENHLSRRKAFELIEKYIHFKPFILERVEKFAEEYFSDSYIISVHYRGTDKFRYESSFVSYSEVISHIDDCIANFGQDNYKIFVATDEQDFLDKLVEIYGDLLCFHPDIQRSKNGEALHLNSQDPYQCGVDAITDALLLSKGNVLIRTVSNLSRWSTYFNPEIPVFEINQMKHYRYIPIVFQIFRFRPSQSPGIERSQVGQYY
jgi:hypothetical protein